MSLRSHSSILDGTNIFPLLHPLSGFCSPGTEDRLFAGPSTGQSAGPSAESLLGDEIRWTLADMEKRMSMMTSATPTLTGELLMQFVGSLHAYTPFVIGCNLAMRHAASSW